MKRKQDLERARRGIEEFLRGLGFDIEDHPELARTAERVVGAFSQDLLSGESMDDATMLKKGSSPARPGEKGIVVLRNLSTVTVCPHHLMPAIGHATVMYVPDKRIAGLGAVARLVDGHARRLVLQEEIGERVAQALVEHLGARGALCRLSLVHTCLVARGERKHDAHVDTVAFAGSLAVPGPDRELAMMELHTR
ncbi:MAG TPA: GTP cyclohydrolase I [Polyangiaceae bacterium]|jgi:GTP cyclohydrolase I|nr:MAG: GTP cyclohydrolase 1 [Deltaproteobacteria bacterium ADurb.Bin207]HNS95692.1 GTP cyclohydrolase I [Polyangiaceae bacterium]HNZ21159.1 GTP cyclohydrolase I [Polyangiaceae bacterium]HOD23703.1 GTP cyclohydrolase I [Polyangiaceae bacterium]HOE48095.1 GTP cyclohydrolase I [Polyangiaceae bacterium]